MSVLWKCRETLAVSPSNASQRAVAEMKSSAGSEKRCDVHSKRQGAGK